MEGQITTRINRSRLRKFGPSLLSVALVRQAVMHMGLKTQQPFGPRWLAAMVGNILHAIYTRCTGVKFTCNTYEAWHADPEKRLDPEKQYMMPWHPHGLVTTTAFFYTSRLSAMSFKPDVIGPKRWFVGVADLLFRFPIVGEHLMLANARSVSDKMVDDLMGKGYSFSLQPGGINEQILTDHQREICVFPRNLGFVRLAIKYGTPLVPIYVYGENQVLTTYEWSRRTTRKIFAASGICVPLFVPVANQITCHQKFGRPVEVGEPQADPGDEVVERVFARYVEELTRMFDEYGNQCLPEDVAAKGITFMWRGHSKQDLDDLLARQGVNLSLCGHTADGFGQPPPTLASTPPRSAL